jgi:hypothetical protein
VSLQGQLQSTLDDLDKGRPSRLPLMDHLDDWISERGAELTKRFGDQISMMYLCQEPPTVRTSQYCLKRCVDGAKERWIGSGPFAVEPKLRAFDTLRIVKDIDAVLRTLSSDNLTDAPRDLIRYWEEDLHKADRDHSSWSLRMRYRLSLLSILIKKLQNTSISPM